MDDFRFRELSPVGKRVLRLGLALNYGIDADRGPKLAWSF